MASAVKVKTLPQLTMTPAPFLSINVISPGLAQVQPLPLEAFPESPSLRSSATYQLCGKLVHLPCASVSSSVKQG